MIRQKLGHFINFITCTNLPEVSLFCLNTIFNTDLLTGDITYFASLQVAPLCLDITLYLQHFPTGGITYISQEVASFCLKLILSSTLPHRWHYIHFASLQVASSYLDTTLHIQHFPTGPHILLEVASFCVRTLFNTFFGGRHYDCGDATCFLFIFLNGFLLSHRHFCHKLVLCC